MNLLIIQLKLSNYLKLKRLLKKVNLSMGPFSKKIIARILARLVLIPKPLQKFRTKCLLVLKININRSKM